MTNPRMTKECRITNARMTNEGRGTKDETLAVRGYAAAPAFVIRPLAFVILSSFGDSSFVILSHGPNGGR